MDFNLLDSLADMPRDGKTRLYFEACPEHGFHMGLICPKGVEIRAGEIVTLGNYSAREMLTLVRGIVELIENSIVPDDTEPLGFYAVASSSTEGN